MVAVREQRTAGLFPYLPTQSGYNKRLRAATGMLRAVIAHLVACTVRCTDDVWAVDLTPVECGRSRKTTKRSDLTGWAKRDADPNLLATHPGQTLVANKNYYGRDSKPRSATPGRVVIGAIFEHRLLRHGAQAERTDSPAGFRKKLPGTRCRWLRRSSFRPCLSQREGSRSVVQLI